MILVDTSVLIYKNLHSAVKYSTTDNNKLIKTVNGKYKLEDFKGLFMHKFLNDLRYVYKTYKNKYGKMILVLDNHTAKNWKKEFYPLYKEGRAKARKESKIDFKEFFAFLEEFLEDIEENFPYDIIEMEKLEADEIIAILTEEYSKIEPILVVSVDKDFNQLYKFNNVKIFNPIKLKQEKTLTEKQLKDWRLEHICLGDTADNVGKIVQDTEFSKEFLSYLKENDIFIEDVLKFNKLSISKKILNEFVEKYPNKEVFKKTRFGPVALKKFLEDFEENLKSNPLYKANYERNKKLVLFEYIPEELQLKCLQKFNHRPEKKINLGKISSYLMKNHLIELFRNAQDFYVPNQKPSLELDFGSSDKLPNSSLNFDSTSSGTSDVSNELSSLDNW